MNAEENTRLGEASDVRVGEMSRVRVRELVDGHCPAGEVDVKLTTPVTHFLLAKSRLVSETSQHVGGRTLRLVAHRFVCAQRDVINGRPFAFREGLVFRCQTLANVLSRLWDEAIVTDSVNRL